MQKIESSIQLLDWFKSTVGISSDYMAAKVLCVSKQMVSDVRNGKKEFSDHISLTILVTAEHEKPLQALAILEAAKAERRGDDKLAEIWRSQAA